jgi:hypothetical protein
MIDKAIGRISAKHKATPAPCHSLKVTVWFKDPATNQCDKMVLRPPLLLQHSLCFFRDTGRPVLGTSSVGKALRARAPLTGAGLGSRVRQQTEGGRPGSQYCLLGLRNVRVCLTRVWKIAI